MLQKFLAFSADCNGRHCELDPFSGGAMAVAESCRNLVCSGAEPIGLTDCLNFGSPERPEIMEQFSRAIDGIAAACEALGVPIVSGNVSLYNETSTKEGTRAILPTPTIGAVGLLRSADDVTTQHFKNAGDVVLLLGESASDGLGGSEYLTRKLGKITGAPPSIDLGAEARLQRLVLDLCHAHTLASAHDVSDGGIAIALVECCASAMDADRDVGARIDLEARASAAATLFGEAPSRVIVSASASHARGVIDAAQTAGVPCTELGVVGGRSLSISIVARHETGAAAVVIPVAELRAARERCLSNITD